MKMTNEKFDQIFNEKVYLRKCKKSNLQKKFNKNVKPYLVNSDDLEKKDDLIVRKATFFEKFIILFLVLVIISLLYYHYFYNI